MRLSELEKTGASVTTSASTQQHIIAAVRSAPDSANGALVIDLDALTRNYAKLRKLASPAECAAAIKGDAYGLGMAKAAPALADAGCRTFFIATLAEAEALRTLLPHAVIGLPPGTAEVLAAMSVRPVLNSLPEINEWNAYCRNMGTPLPAAIHIDTGMNRLGVKVTDCETLLDPPPEPDRDAPPARTFPVSLLMSHLACADDPAHPKNAAQLEAFRVLAGQFSASARSLANSAGVLLGAPYHFDMVRPGIGLYGGNPRVNGPNPMEPVAHLFGRIAAIGTARAGETVGYGATRRLTRPTRFATVGVGYADGYFRALGAPDGHKGAVACHGEKRLPILGRVSMDLTVFDITDLPEGALHPGDFVELMGAHFTVDEAAALAGTINYEMLTNLGSRYHRVYIGAKNRD
ncbi:MAG: alanine racemase, partial [Alphaproteobacteria bacterium]